ncbi:UNVERIFIED_CONTAM: hypothetical protein ABID98_001877 [Brevibacillus sp. OAP136]
MSLNLLELLTLILCFATVIISFMTWMINRKTWKLLKELDKDSGIKNGKEPKVKG